MQTDSMTQPEHFWQADIEAARLLEAKADECRQSNVIIAWKLDRARNHLLERSRWENLG